MQLVLVPFGHLDLFHTKVQYSWASSFLWKVMSSGEDKWHRAELVENWVHIMHWGQIQCFLEILKYWNILELEIKIIIFPGLKFNKELRLYNTHYFEQVTNAVPVGHSNDCYTCAIWQSREHRMPDRSIYEQGWIFVLYHLINAKKVFINRRTIKNATICSK